MNNTKQAVRGDIIEEMNKALAIVKSLVGGAEFPVNVQLSEASLRLEWAVSQLTELPATEEQEAEAGESEWGPWIEHDGKSPCPIPGARSYMLRFNDGIEGAYDEKPAHKWSCWEHTDSGQSMGINILAYRLKNTGRGPGARECMPRGSDGFASAYLKAEG